MGLSAWIILFQNILRKVETLLKEHSVENQCIRYCLDKPGVLAVLPGAQSVSEVDELLSYYDRTEEELDYSVISSFAPPQANGKCVYCNHCKPCPVGIDIGLVNKYFYFLGVPRLSPILRRYHSFFLITGLGIDVGGSHRLMAHTLLKYKEIFFTLIKLHGKA